MVRRIWMLAAVVVVAALLLVGCAAGADGGGAQDGTGAQPGAGAQAGADDKTPVSAENEITISSTDIVNPDSEAPIVLDILGTPVAQPELERLEGSALVSALLDAPLVSQGAQVGAVRGLVMDTSNGQAHYLVIDASGEQAGKSYLLPWLLVRIEHHAAEPSAPSDDQSAAALPAGDVDALDGLRVVLAEQAAEMTDAPAVPEADLAAWERSETLTDGWDASARAYWAAYLLDAKVSGADGSGGAESSGSLVYLGGRPFESSRWRVRDDDNDVTGRVQDIFLNASGAASFAALYLPNFRQQDDLSVVLPWQMLIWKAEDRAFYLTASNDALAGAPLFDRQALPDISLPGWDQDWQRYWQQYQAGNGTVNGGAVSGGAVNGGGAAGSPARGIDPSGGRGQVLVSRLTGRPMLDAAGDVIGVIEDIVMGPDGDLRYLVLRSEQRSRPVPWLAFDYAEDALIYIDDPARLDDAPGYDSAAAIDTSVPGWDRELRVYWGLGR